MCFRKHHNDMGRRRNDKNYVVIRDTDLGEDNIAIPQARTVTLSANHRRIQQTPCSPQKSCRFAQPAPSYHWNPSPQYDLQELDDGFQHAHITESTSAQASDVAAKVASKRYPTSVSVLVVISTPFPQLCRMHLFKNGLGGPKKTPASGRSSYRRC